MDKKGEEGGDNEDEDEEGGRGGGLKVKRVGGGILRTSPVQIQTGPDGG